MCKSCLDHQLTYKLKYRWRVAVFPFYCRIMVLTDILPPSPFKILKILLNGEKFHFCGLRILATLLIKHHALKSMKSSGEKLKPSNFTIDFQFPTVKPNDLENKAKFPRKLNVN
jgi:hypothetical protein